MAISLRRMGAGVAGFARHISALRPLALMRASRLAAGLLAPWRVPPTIMRPWQSSLRHEPWLGRVPRFEYRLRRRPEPEAAARPAARRARAAGSEEWQPFALPGDDFEAEREAALPFGAPLDWGAEDAGAEAPAPWLALDGLIEPLSLPREFASARPTASAPPGGEIRAAAAAAPRRVVAARMPAARPPPESAQRRSGLTGGTRASASIGSRSGENETAAAPLPPAEAPPQAAEGTQPPLPGATAHEQRVEWRPPWPFQFLSPSVVATVAAEASETGAPYIAPVRVRRAAQRMPGGQTAPTAAGIGVPAALAAAEWAIRADPAQTLRMRPAETMLTHVVLPAAETGPLAEAAETHAGELRRVARAPERAAAGRELPAQADDISSAGEQTGIGTGEPIEPAESVAEAPAGPRMAIGVSESPVTREFPVLGLLRAVGGRSAEARAAGEQAPTAMQVLRRMTAAQMQRALMGLADLTALGAGEALPAGVRRPMEVILGRDLSAVRTYTSPVAETMGAEAFTTGERVVFAPGRMDVRSPRGLAVLAHELTHVGQPLAFKQSAGTDTGDSAEQRAQAQESEIERIVEQGWPQAPRMDVRQAAHALSVLAHGGDGAGAGGRGANLQFEQRALEGGEAAASGASEAASGGALPSARLSEVQAATAAGSGGPAPDVEKLARDVYDILKARLRAEKTRHDVY